MSFLAWLNGLKGSISRADSDPRKKAPQGDVAVLGLPPMESPQPLPPLITRNEELPLVATLRKHRRQLGKNSESSSTPSNLENEPWLARAAHAPLNEGGTVATPARSTALPKIDGKVYRSKDLTGRRSSSSHRELRSQAARLSLEQGLAFIRLVPTAMCILDRTGFVRGINLAFRNSICSEESSSSQSPLILTFFTSERDMNRFYASLMRLSKSTSLDETFITEQYVTRVRTEDGTAEVPYNWTISWDADRTFLLLTGSRIEGNRVCHPNAGCPRSSSANVRGRAYDGDFFEPNETQSQFVRYVSHELRTPLNIALAGIDLMMTSSPGLSADLLATTIDVKSACTTGVDVLNDLNTYEKLLHLNTLVLSRSNHHLTDLVNQAVMSVSQQAENSRIYLIVENLLNENDDVINGDSHLLTQAIRSLLLSGLKYTPTDGAVTVRLSFESNLEVVSIEVIDSGPGMSARDKEVLSMEGFKFDQWDLQTTQGFGLSLFLAERILDMHDGVMGVDVEHEGNGSIFFMKLPIARKDVM